MFLLLLLLLLFILFYFIFGLYYHKCQLFRFFMNEKFLINTGISLVLNLNLCLSIWLVNLFQIIFPVRKWIFAFTKNGNSWHLWTFFSILEKIKGHDITQIFFFFSFPEHDLNDRFRCILTI